MKYIPYGPFEVSTNQHGFVDESQKSAKHSNFWKLVDELDARLRNAKGCYIFCTGAKKNIVPWYVGKTSNQKGFFGEVFEPHKMNLYHKILQPYKYTPTPSIILLCRVTNGKEVPAKSIEDGELLWVEKLLIRAAYHRNKNLINTKDTKLLRELVIPGFFGSAGRGNARSHEARALSRCMKK